MKPFLILQLRPNDQASDGEYKAFLKFGKLSESDTVRIRMDQTGVPSNINLDDYSGVIVGGGPSNVSDSPEKKSPEQKKFESELTPLLDQIIEHDFPFLGACYGLGYLATHQGATVSKEKYSEGISAPVISLTEEGKKDPLLQGLPEKFQAFVGHKEACQGIPENSVLLATGDICPHQMIRIKNNIYATQFHPELDSDGIVLRINVYKNAGYFPPEDAEKLIKEAYEQEVSVPEKILARFVERYKK